jgi:hypothetical protein
MILQTVLVLTFAGSVFAADSSTEQFLQQFHQNPEKMMNRLPPNIENGKVIDRGFLNSEILDQKLLDEKEARRNEVIKRAVPTFQTFSIILEKDNPAILVDSGVVVSNILELDKRGLNNHSVPQPMWSDSYWPYQKGLLAARYADPGFPNSADWMVNYSYHLAVPPALTDPNNLSPAEKYDLLVGDNTMGLTEFSWARGKKLYDENNNSVPGWMGICHGWSGATHMKAKIPFGSITLKTPAGGSIKFYQSDVKALTSLLWANSEPQTKFLGFRCEGTPPRDGTGRVIDPNCLDNNPATFFLSLTNQLGINNRSFVMDATWDAEVWNYAVVSYKSTYFNPQTFQQSDNLREGIIPVSQFTIDKFKTYRSPNTAFVLGMTVDVTHMNEAGANHSVQTKPSTLTKRYIYDLELDANYNVIGGEWYSRVHPDFIWTFPVDSQALAPGDADINANDWNVAGPVPPTWAAAAQKSSKMGAPLFSVIKKIVEAAPSSPAAAAAAGDEVQ